MFLSLIIPVKDEVVSINFLAAEIKIAMTAMLHSWECIWIDDGSTDASLNVLQNLCATNHRHQWLSLSDNFGQSAALYAGFMAASGKYIATMDADGQNDPKDIPILLNKLIADDLDMANGIRQNRSDTLSRKIASKIANRFRNRLTGENITDIGCSMRVFKRECVQHIPLFKGMHRFFPTLVRLNGFSKIIEMPVQHRPRKYGITKYGIHNRLWAGLADLLAVMWMQRRMVFPKTKDTSFTISKQKDIMPWKCSG